MQSWPITRLSKAETYSWAGDAPEHVGNDGDGAVEALLAGANRKISRGSIKRGIKFQEVIAGWLKRLGLLSSFKAKRISPNRKEYEVRVCTPNSAKEVQLARCWLWDFASSSCSSRELLCRPSFNGNH